MCVQVPTETRSIGFHKAVLTSGCELPDRVGEAGIKLWSLA